MSNRRVAICAAAFAFSASSAVGDDGSANSVGVTDARNAPASEAKSARGLPTMADKKMSVEAATRGFGAQPPNAKPLMGDFPPFGGQSVNEWKAERKRRSEREYERLEKLTPKEQDEEHAERKRRQEEWQKMRPQEKAPAQ